jgi:DNA-binding NtrC family response regulator
MPAARVLIIEDEMLVAMSIEDALSDAGFSVAGIMARVSDALALLERDNGIDAAVMDLNLAGEPSGPVADRLKELGIPFLVVTGYGSAGLPPHHKKAPVLAKPFQPERIVATLKNLLPPKT